MANNEQKTKLKKLLAQADIKIGGNRAQDIQINDDRFYDRVFSDGSLGVGESYMDGWWSSKQLDKTMTLAFKANLAERLGLDDKVKFALYHIKARIANQQAGKKAYKNAQSHYDIGNDLYEPMLGRTMAYTCAYWAWGAKTLDQAQTDKYELICKKLGLKKGMTVLDVGCGWGELAIYMVKKYGCEVVCLTPSHEQIAYIKKNAKSTKVKPVLTTWQDYSGKVKFDRIAAIGIMEHVGPKNYDAFITKMHNLVKPDGLFILHTIGSNRSIISMDPWIETYIFPGGVLPSIKQIATAAEGKFVMEDWHNMGANYDPTLMSWYKNFAKSYPKLDHQKYDERFRRMWEFYLLACAGQFRARNIQLWQVIYSPKGVVGGYKSVR